jgi:hypothetical protein
MRMARGILSRPTAQVALIACAAGLLYFLVFGARFAFPAYDVGPGGDTQNVWSVYWAATYSLWKFGEFLWWDPTSLNGWPAYYLNNHGWSTMLSPFQLAQQLLGVALQCLFNLEVTQFLIMQKTMIVVFINIVGITLISRELLTSIVARVFPPLVYALCQMQFLGYVAAATVEALPAVIFLLYGLIYYNNRRTPFSLMVLLLFAGIYAASVNYMTLTSHVYPLALFMLLVLVFFPAFLSSLWTNSRLLASRRHGAVTLGAGVAFVLAGCAVFAIGVRSNLPNFARLVDASEPYDINRIGSWDGPTYGITSADLWTSLFYWIPYSDLHQLTMNFDPYGAGNDYRYIGLVTLPLIVIALVSRLQARYATCFALATFFCLGFVALTHNNLPFSLLIENFGVFRNIRTMSLIMPRDLLALFPIFLAAIGLDALFLRSTAPGQTTERRAITVVLGGLILMGVWCLFTLATSPELSDLRKSLGHAGVYLVIFSALLLAAVHAADSRLAQGLAWVVLMVALVDLNAAASDQWFNNNGGGRYYHGRHASAMNAEKTGIRPIASEAESWPGLYYNGMVHNVHHGGPHFGHKYWLSLVTRPAWQPVVDNWNPRTRMMTEYPRFKFFTNGAFVPEGAIHNIDEVKPPATELPARIMPGGKELRLDGRRVAVIEADLGAVERTEKSIAHVGRHVVAGSVTERARLVLVFVGDELWYRGSPNQTKPGAFVFELELPEDAVKRAVGVRAFASTDDGRAAELKYPKDYPFSTAAGKVVARKPEAASVKGPTFYLHDAALVKPGVEGKRLYDAKWEVQNFTFNRVKVKVELPEPAYMVYLDNYDRYWRAYVNGARTKIERANFAFKTVYLPAGTSVVEWVYNPWRTKVAWMLYYLMFAVALGLFWWWARAQRVTGESATIRP